MRALADRVVAEPHLARVTVAPITTNVRGLSKEEGLTEAIHAAFDLE